MSNSVEKLIGARIARMRKEREITQEQLAELVDVATETISRLERGVSMPSLKILEKISYALHISLKDLFDFEYPQKPKGTAFEQENEKLIAYLRTRSGDDIKMCYHILKNVFEQIEKNYFPKNT
ncbi:MAG: helix-turn-helix transcriptional regulator [Deltaproteobacteria bacterium]|nr:helix-turn-helix transcriptional regulator [Deltaproteobacteria bacterium]